LKYANEVVFREIAVDNSDSTHYLPYVNKDVLPLTRL